MKLKFYFLVSLNRNAIWQSTYEFLLKKTPTEFALRNLIFKFDNEEGVDLGKIKKKKIIFFYVFFLFLFLNI